MFAVADDPNAYVAWTVQRDGLLRMRTSSNVRHVGPDPNDRLTLASFAYDRAVMGLPESETVTPLLSPAQPRRFDYDPLDRLIRVTYGTDPNRTPDPNTDPYESFALDLAGNRIDYEDRQGNTTHYEPNAGNVSNQYTDITPGVDEPNYDTAGNLTVDHRGYEYFYDHDNHLTGVRKPITALATFEYDALGRRIFMTDWTAMPIEYRQYIYSGQNVVEEYDEPNHRACYYVHGPSYIDERVLMYDEASEADYVYLLKDLYTVAGLADARGWLVEAYDYDAYGKVTMRRCAVLPDAADYDADGDVDDDDLAVFDAHQNGPGNDPCDVTSPSVIPGWRSDFDGDGDVDGVDYIVFAHAYGGAGVDPRGDRMLLSGPMPGSRVANPYFFTGRRLDLLDIDDANTPNHFTDDTARLPLYYYRMRTMDPLLARFLQQEPAGVAMTLDWPRRLTGPQLDVGSHAPAQYRDTAHLYEYAHTSPLTWVDWDGQRPEKPSDPLDPVGPPWPPGGRDCGIRVRQTPFCDPLRPGHTWIQWGSGDKGETADYPYQYIQRRNRRCQKRDEYVWKEWTVLVPVHKSCEEAKQDLLDAEKKWRTQNFNLLKRNCRDFVSCALTEAEIMPPFGPPTGGKGTWLKYCCSACSFGLKKE